MQGLLHLTKAETVQDYKAALSGCFAALARANSLIAESRWANVDLRSLVEEPSRKSTGSSVIAGAVRQLGGEMFREWLPFGLHCTLLCSMARLSGHGASRPDYGR